MTTAEDKAEAVLAAFRGEVPCPTCGEYGQRPTIEATGYCDACYHARVRAMQDRLARDQAREHRNSWKKTPFWIGDK